MMSKPCRRAVVSYNLDSPDVTVDAAHRLCWKQTHGRQFRSRQEKPLRRSECAFEASVAGADMYKTTRSTADVPGRPGER
jgi:hypothetical protein